MCEHEFVNDSKWVKKETPAIITLNTFDCSPFANRTLPMIVTPERGERFMTDGNFTADYVHVIHQGTAGFLMLKNEFLHRYKPYVHEIDIEQQLAAANARVAELEQDNARQKRLATISRLCKNVQACRAEKLEAKILQMEDAIKFDFERFMEFQQRAEQAEAQNKRMQTAINRYVIGNIELLDAMKAALEEKP